MSGDDSRTVLRSSYEGPATSGGRDLRENTSSLLRDPLVHVQADEQPKKRRVFKKFTFRGLELEKLIEMGVNKQYKELLPLLTSRIRRKFKHQLKAKQIRLMKKVQDAIKAAPVGDDGIREKPATIKTHLRNMVILPQMVGGVIGVYNGKSYVTVEIKPAMIGKYLGEFSITYKPVRHGRPGIGATNSSRFIPLK